MDLNEFNKAVEIALRYFALQGIAGEDMRRDIGKHVWDLLEEGEKRPLMLGNKAIERMEHQIDAELELSSEQLDVIFSRA
jgi:hypothetical protein